MNDINMAIVSGNRIIQAVNLPHNPDKPVSVKALKGARYVLAEGDDLTAPDIVSIKREGNDLHLMLQGGNSAHSNLIIEDYFTKYGEIVGLGEDGQWHAFSAVSADPAQDPQTLQEGEQSTLALDSTVLPPLNNLQVDSNALAFGLIALGAAAAVTALAVLVRSNDNDHTSPPSGNTTVVPEVTPEEASHLLDNPATIIDKIQDDVGEMQGVLLPNDITDDNTPTLNGSDQQAGSVIEILDNSMFLGTAIADSKGNWSFTPASPLPDGTHKFVAIATDPAGVVSAPSDPAVIVIASKNAPVETFSLSDLLPADTDLSSWAYTVNNDEPGVEYYNVAPANDTSHLLDELLSCHPLN